MAVYSALKNTHAVLVESFFDWQGALDLFTDLPCGFTKAYYYEVTITKDGLMLNGWSSLSSMRGGLRPLVVHNWGPPDVLRPKVLMKVFKRMLPRDATPDAVASALKTQRWGLPVLPPRELATSKVEALIKKLPFIPKEHHAFYGDVVAAVSTAAAVAPERDAPEAPPPLKRPVGRPAEAAKAPPLICTKQQFMDFWVTKLPKRPRDEDQNAPAPAPAPALQDVPELCVVCGRPLRASHAVQCPGCKIILHTGCMSHSSDGACSFC